MRQGTVSHSCIMPGISTEPEAFAPGIKAIGNARVCASFLQGENEGERLHEGTDNTKL